jgi:hypothetical protein
VEFSLGKNKGFNVIHQNIRSLRQNFDFFISELTEMENSPEVIILTEIWINSNESSLYNIQGYNKYFKCNDDYRAGGVAVYIKNSIEVINHVTEQFHTADVIGIRFRVLEQSFTLFACYRILKCSREVFVDELENLLITKGVSKNSNNVLFIGDLNINLLESSNFVDNYKILMASNGFECLVNEPTRVTTDSATCIDHVFSRVSDKSRVTVETEVRHVGITDHSLCSVSVSVAGRGEAGVDGERRHSSASATPVSYRIDYALLSQNLDSADWESVYKQSSATSAFDSFFAIFRSSLENSKVKISTKNHFKKLKPWINDFICMKIRIRNKIYLKLRKHPNNVKLRNYYLKFRNKLQDKIREVKQLYYKNKFKNCDGNSKATWRVINEITGQKSQNINVISLEINKESVSDPCLVSEEFNNYFLKVVDALKIDQPKPDNFSSLKFKELFKTKFQPNSMFLDPVTPDDICKIINTLKSGTSPGIDGINSLVIKKTSKNIAKILCFIINLSLEKGEFPEKLKEAVVIPIFKSGLKNVCSNYRPISLLSVFSKIFEKVMKIKLISFLEKNNFFSDCQFGFREGMNTEHALQNFMTNVYDGLNKGKGVSGLFLDIKKAFDTVDHGILLQKLYISGIRGVSYNWFKSYLVERKQCVKIGNKYSGMQNIRCGVPQGSVLGAILFLVYINDLCNAAFKGKLTSFADDTALCYVENDWLTIEQNINNDLDALQWWFTENHMLLSPEKTKYINFNLRKEINFGNLIVYKCINCLCGKDKCNMIPCSLIEKVKCIKYLGIMVDSEVNWKTHISNLKLKLNGVLRYFYFLNNIKNFVFFSCSK